MKDTTLRLQLRQPTPESEFERLMDMPEDQWNREIEAMIDGLDRFEDPNPNLSRFGELVADFLEDSWDDQTEPNLQIQDLGNGRFLLR